MCDSDENLRRSKLLGKLVRRWWRLSPIFHGDKSSPPVSVDWVRCLDLMGPLLWAAVSAQTVPASFLWSVFQWDLVSDDTRSYCGRSFHGTCKTFQFGFVFLTMALVQAFDIELFHRFVTTSPLVMYSEGCNSQTLDSCTAGQDFDLVFWFDSRSLFAELVCF